MVLLKLFPFLPLLSSAMVWVVSCHPNRETRRKRAEIFLILCRILVPIFLFVVYLIFR